MKVRAIPYLMLLPAAVFCLMFFVLPMCLVGYLSLFESNYIISRYIGFDNYVRIFNDYQFLRSIGNGFIYVMFAVPTTTGSALFIALVIMDWKIRYRTAVLIATYIPALAAGVIIARTWKWIFATKGLINYLLSIVGLGPVYWFSMRWPALGAIAFMQSTAVMGALTLLFVASTMSIPVELVDAARIDGARFWQIRRYVVLPAISPMVHLAILIGIAGNMLIWETINFTSGGGPRGGTATMITQLVQAGFEYSRYGLASAMGVVSLVIVFIVSWLKRRVERAA